jgi:hypothetical protein
MRPNLLVPIVLVLSGPAFGQEPALDDLPAARDFESHRITSADPTGGNADWWDIGPGQTRVLAEIQAPGRIVRIYWDGEKLCEPVDFYSAANVTRLTTLGERDLTRGQHRLTVEVVGTNPAAKPRYMLGLDYVRLESVR